jgi:hypothetical protein
MVRRWFVDGIAGAATSGAAIVVGQLAMRGGVDDWSLPAIVALFSFVVYPEFARRARNR